MNIHLLCRGPHSLFALLVASSPLLLAQSSPVGHLTGTVKTPDGKVVANQLVRVETPRGTREVRTDATGMFLVPNLVPGKVAVKVATPGMSDFRADIVVVVNQTATLNIRLQPQAGVVVEVVAQATLVTVDPNQAKTGMTTDFGKINELPVVGSGFDRLDQTLWLAPGANRDTIHGTDAYQNNFQVDGVDVTNANYGGSQAKLNNDFIDQVQVLTSGISARYGRFSGGVVNVTTKTGTNQFEGSTRLEITNQKWNSRGKWPELYSMFGMTPTDPVDAHHITQSYTFSGPIVKDRLFFALGYQTNSPQTKYQFKTYSARFGGVPYEGTSDENRKDAKLDWVVNSSHRIFFQANEAVTEQDNMFLDGMSTSLATLCGLSKSKKGYWSVGYTGQLSNTMTMDAKYNDAYGESGGSGTGPRGAAKTVPTWYDYQSRDILDNGLGSDAKVENHMKMASASVTWFGEALGMHQLETGFQGYQYTYESAAGKTPSGYYITFNDYATGATTPALANRLLTVNNPVTTSLKWYQPVQGQVDTRVNSLYVNDTWSVQERWVFNLGLRFDRYESDSTPEGNHYAFGALTPRLAASYDLRGNGAHVFSLSASEYAGAILQGQLGGASVSQTPIRRDYVYWGTGGTAQGTGLDALTSVGGINWAAWGNQAGLRGQENPNTVQDPLTDRNVFVDPNIKAPRTRELTMGYRSDLQGRAFSATVVRRWNDRFVDDVWYGNGMRPGLAKRVITNDPTGHTNYYGLELTWRHQVTERFSYGANATWSRNLGDAGMTLNGATAQANNFGDGIPKSQLNPYGPIPNLDMPLIGNADASYQMPLGKGTFNVGLLATYRGRWAAGFPTGMALTPDALVAQGYEATYDRAFPELGVLHQPQEFNVHLQLGVEHPVFRRARMFAKLNIQNLFNAMPVTNYQYYGDATSGTYTPMAPYDGKIAAYQTGRNIQLVTGLRF